MKPRISRAEPIHTYLGIGCTVRICASKISINGVSTVIETSDLMREGVENCLWGRRDALLLLPESHKNDVEILNIEYIINRMDGESYDPARTRAIQRARTS